MGQRFFDFAKFDVDETTPSAIRMGAKIPDNLVTLASAGTGKTFQLSSRYLQLLAADQPIERILATTFTRKAAGEIFDRVVERLVRAASDQTAREELAVSIGVPELTTEGCSAMLARLTRQLNRMRIETLDAFFGTIARSYSFEIGLPPAWDIVDAQQEQQLKKQAVGLTIREVGHSAMVPMLDLITKGESRTSISRLMLTEIDNVYEGLYLPTELDGGAAWDAVPDLALPSGDEYEQAIEQLRDLNVSELGHRTLQKGYYDSVTSFQDGDFEGFLSKGVPKYVLSGKHSYHGKPLSEVAVAQYRSAIDVARRMVINATRLRTIGAYELAKAFSTRYDQLKIDNESITFSDVTHHLCRWNQQSDFSQLEYRLGGTIDHLLLDEFQDTSAVQWDCIQPFIKAVLAAGPRKSYFCVGDVKQSIYGWRGGQPDILATMPERLNLERQELTASYRSSQVIIDVVNRFFRRLDQHANLGDHQATFTEWQEAFPIHETKRSLSGYASLEVAPAAEDGDDGRQSDLRYAAHRIKEVAEGAPHHSIGVLFRSNADVGHMIFHLRELDVDASEEGKNPITDSEAVSQILSLLNLADHPTDLLSAIHASTGPLADHFELDWRLFMPSRRWPAAARLARKIRRRLLVEGYDRCIERWAKWLEPMCSNREHYRLAQLVDLAYQYQPRSTLRPSDFVAFVKSYALADPNTARVRVMTVHQAKGLEFDSVFLLPAGRGIPFFHSPSFASEQDAHSFRPRKICRYVKHEKQKIFPDVLQQVFRAEHRRQAREYLCLEYVSVTRAKRALHIIVPDGTKEGNKSPAGLYVAALRDGVQRTNQRLYEAGERDWYHSDPACESHNEFEESLPSYPAELTLRPLAENDHAAKDIVAPSRRFAKSQVNGAEFFSEARESALERGTLIHAWMETIPWLSDELPDVHRMNRVAIQLGSKLVDQDQALEEFHRIIRRPAIRSLLIERDYEVDIRQWMTSRDLPIPEPIRIEARNEQRITVEEDGQFVNGEIDRLLLVFSGENIVAADIVDYKTDRIETASDHQRLGENYRPQLEAYREAVARAFGVERKAIRTRLFLLRADASVDIRFD